MLKLSQPGDIGLVPHTQPARMLARVNPVAWLTTLL